MEFKEYNQQHHSENIPPLDLIARKLHDHVSAETKETQTILTEHGIRDLPAFITFDTTFDTPITPLVEAPLVVEEEVHQESHMSTPNSVDTTRTELPNESTEDERELYVFTATSQQQLQDEMLSYYMDNALEATKKTLAQKNISEDRIPQVAQQIITEIAQKKINAFHDAQIRHLIKQNFLKQDAEDYYTWRINNADMDISFSLEKDIENNHALHSANFINDHFMSLFLQERSIEENNIPHQEMPDTAPSIQEPSVHTSAHINAMFDELKNL